MAKKGKSDGGTKLGVGEAGALKHNPFAALAGAVGGASSEPSREPPAPTATPPAQPPANAAKSEPARDGSAKVKSRGRLVLRRETKHRGGKAVIIVRGFATLKDFDDAKIAELAKELKQKLGCGGTVEHGDGEVEIVLQGDRAAKVAELLRAQNFRVDGVTS